MSATKKYKIGGRVISGTNLDKTFFRKPSIKKKEILEYYSKIAPFMLPHIVFRPTNMMRAPDGMFGNIFYQQNAPKYFPEWIDLAKTFRIRGGFGSHVLANNTETLVYLANEGVVTLHIWNSRGGNLKKPDRIVFDLDPHKEKMGFEMVREIAFALRRELEKLGGTPYVMTTGSKGVHLILPIKPDTDFKIVKRFAKQIVDGVENIYHDKVTTNFRKSKRVGKVFLDYLRNSYGQTAVAPYSVRLRRGAPIACPIFWTDLHKKDFGPQAINIKNVFTYLKKGDPWKDMHKNVRSVRYYIARLNKLSEER